MYISVDGGISFPLEMNIFHLPTLGALHFRHLREDPTGVDQFYWEKSSHFCGQLGCLQELHLTGYVGTTEAVIALLQHAPMLTWLTLDIFADYQVLIPILFCSYSGPLLQHLGELELHLEPGELPAYRGPANNVTVVM
jgi:hypothetical protein